MRVPVLYLLSLPLNSAWFGIADVFLTKLVGYDSYADTKGLHTMAMNSARLVERLLLSPLILTC